MKKYLLLFSLLLSFSCSKDDSPEKEKDLPITILGIWYYDYYTVDGERFENEYENEGCNSDFEKAYKEYRDDGTFSISSFQDCEWTHWPDYQYTLNGTKLVARMSDKDSWRTDKVILLTESKLGILSGNELNEHEYVEYFKR